MMNAAVGPPLKSGVGRTCCSAGSTSGDEDQFKENNMKRTKAGRVLSAAGGAAIGVLLAVPLGGALAGTAGADATCYTGCTTAATGITTSSGTAATPTATPVTASSSSSLAFTGADISEMAIIGVAAIGVGAVLVRRRRTTA
jgi:hypothetical protein